MSDSESSGTIERDRLRQIGAADGPDRCPVQTCRCQAQAAVQAELPLPAKTPLMRGLLFSGRAFMRAAAAPRPPLARHILFSK